MIKADMKTKSVQLDGQTAELCVEATMILISIKSQINSLQAGVGDALLDLLYNMAKNDEVSGISIGTKIDLSELAKQIKKEGNDA